MAAHSGAPIILPVHTVETPANSWVWVQQIAQRTNLIIEWIHLHPAAAAEAAQVAELRAALQDALRRIEALEAAAGP